MARTASNARDRRCIYVVYVIKNMLDGKTYVGKTSGKNVDAAIAYRWKQHLRHARRGAHWKLARALAKHGPQNFSIVPLHTCAAERGAFACEKREVARFRPEYNLTPGGEGSTGYRWTEAQRAKVAGKPRGPMNEEHKANLRHPKTAEHARNIALGKIGRPYRRTKFTAAQLARKAARQAGLKVYSGAPCKSGHDAHRYVSTGQCCECHKLRYLASVGGQYLGKGPKTQSAEARSAISRAMSGRPKPAETRAKMSIAAKAREAARRQTEIEHHV